MIILTLPFWYMYWASTISLIQNDQNNGRFKMNINPCFKRSIVVGILIILVIVIIASVVTSVTSNARTKGKFHSDEFLMISLYAKSLWFLLNDMTSNEK